MGYRIKRSKAFEKDLDSIFNHIYNSYITYGNSVERATESACERIIQIEKDIELLSRTPHQGTLRPELGLGTRNVTKRSVIFYFDVDDENETVSLIAAFFGRQDHLRHIRNRINFQT